MVDWLKRSQVNKTTVKPNSCSMLTTNRGATSPLFEYLYIVEVLEQEPEESLITWRKSQPNTSIMLYSGT